MKTKLILFIGFFVSALFANAQYATLGWNKFTDSQVIVPNKNLILGNHENGPNMRIVYYGDQYAGDGYIKYPRHLYFLNSQDNPLIQIHENGNVGIGMLGPYYKLEVNGTIRAKEIRVESGWADFVFSPDYSLMPLKEVKSYIEENNHLPNIPTESEVKENGVGLSDMTTKLLQKIEELTLYVIQQDEKIDELNKKLSDLENSK